MGCLKGKGGKSLSSKHRQDPQTALDTSNQIKTGPGCLAREGRRQPRKPLFRPYLDIWDAVQVQGAQDVEHETAFVILGKTWSVDGRPHLVHNLPKGALERCGCCGCGDNRDWLAPSTSTSGISKLHVPISFPLTRKQELKREVVLSRWQTSYRDKKEVGANQRKSIVATVPDQK